MKIALVHDYIKEYGGAERVLEALHEIWPDAPVFTTVYLPEFLGPHRERFKDWNIKTSFLQYLPFKEKLISPFRLIAPFVFKTFDFSQFDIVIVSATGAYIPNTIQCHPELVSGSNSSGNEMPKRVRHDIGNGPIQICYCHTPPRYLYGFATAREWKKNLFFKILGEIANHFLRLVDFKSAQNVDFFIANSKNVAGRIKKFYRKESTVIYPPVDVARSQSHVSDDARSTFSKNQLISRSLSESRLQSETKSSFSSSESGLPLRSYFLAGGRLARPKHIDLIIKTFEKLELPLKIFGRGFAGAELKSQSPNIEFLGEVSDEEKLELMKNAKAFVFAAEDEDFGITPVEAMSVGTPVIAFASGGVLETVIENPSAGSGSATGIFYRFNDLNHLSEAINKFEKMKFERESVIKHVQKFSKERFKKEIKEFVESKLR